MEDAKLLIKEDGKPYSDQKALSKVVTKLTKKAGLNYSCHSLRRKFCQDMAFKHNVALPIIAEIIGHNPKDIETLMTSYCLIPPNKSIEVSKNIID
tara:strand:- start:254 stop:541 length:288 start_codon:yes stop_codon:yes gene_type:complete